MRRSSMVPCGSCQRHVKLTAGQCPFCSADLGISRAPTAATHILVGAALWVGGCGDKAKGGDGGDGTTSIGTTDVGGTMAGTVSTGVTGTTTAQSSTAGATSSGGLTAGTDSTGTGTDSTDTGYCDPDPGTSGAVFYATPPDVVNWDCNIFAQDCTAGFKCTSVSPEGALEPSVKAECVEVAAEPREVGESCVVQEHVLSGRDDCDVGAWCWNVDPQTLQGTCVALCGRCPGEPECAPDGTSCVRMSNGLPVCVGSCDPLDDPCPDGEVCIWGGTEFSCFADFADPAGGEYGDSCTDDWDCHSGACWLGSDCATGACCTDWCDTRTPDTCPGAAEGEICMSYGRGERPTLGRCALPP